MQAQEPNLRILLKKYRIRPDSRLGQNFLVDSASLDKVVLAAGLIGDETVLEIGAGLGSLTRRLASAARRVIAVEYDQRLLPPLEEMTASLEGVEIISGDILALNLAALLRDEPYYVVANIPYNITSALIRRLLEIPNPANRIVLTIQREVADRIVAKAGDMSILALSVQIYGRPAVVAHIPAAAFYPQPRVESAVVRIDIHREPLLPHSLITPFFRVAKAGFSQRRKQLKNALSGGLAITTEESMALLDAAHISHQRRAQELSIEEWVRLANIWQDSN